MSNKQTYEKMLDFSGYKETDRKSQVLTWMWKNWNTYIVDEI